MNRRDGATATTAATPSQLAHLESILQELSKHEERTNLHSVEQTSVRTQQRLLKDQLLQAQEELATAQGSKAKLCETIGMLQQVKDEKEKEIAQLKMELHAARESQSMLVKTVADLQESTRKVKRHYIRQLYKANSLPRVQDISIANEIAGKCDEWVGSEPNKRKRAVEDTTCAKVSNSSPGKEEPPTITSDQTDFALDAEMTTEKHTTNSPNDNDVEIDQSIERVAKSTTTPTECEQCSIISAENEKKTKDLLDRIEQFEAEQAQIEAKNMKLVEDYSVLAAEGKSVKQALQAKDDEIASLHKQLLDTKDKLKLESEPIAESDNANSATDLENRLKLLEDNLAQMNGYADQLELVISQCPSCTIKLQSDSTQDSMMKTD